MKSAVRLLLASCFAVSLFLLTSCSGYNKQMIKYLGNKNNYSSYSGEICDVYYYDDSHNKNSVLSLDSLPDTEVIFEISFDHPGIVQVFLGGTPNADRPLDDYKFQFHVTKENNRILKENGFYDVVTRNTKIEIISSDFIYMDSNFFFVAGVTYNNDEYLPFESGFSNIEKYITQNKSLL